MTLERRNGTCCIRVQHCLQSEAFTVDSERRDMVSADQWHKEESFANGNYRRDAEVQCPGIAGSKRVPSAADNFLPSLKSSCKTFGIYLRSNISLLVSRSARHHRRYMIVLIERSALGYWLN